MKSKEKQITIIILFFSLMLSFIFFGKNLKAQMGIIDDHHHISRGVLEDSVNVYQNFIEAPELINFGKSSRFRVMYWVIQDIQTALWGMNATYWYLVNILVFAFFIFAIFYISWKNLSIKWAFPITLFMLGQVYFAFIFTRLGTAETWTMLGTSIYALGYASVYRKMKNKDNKSNWMEWFSMLVGILIAVGSKENFSIIFVAVISLLIILKHYKAITKSAIIMSMLMLAINAYQIAYIFTMQMNKGVDLYQNDLSISHRLIQLVQSVFVGQVLFFVIIAILFFVLLVVFRIYLWKKEINGNSLKKEIYDKLLFNPFIFFVVISAFFIFNVYVYEGKFYTEHRYAFPYVFLIQLLIILVFYWFWSVKKIYFSQCCVKTFKVVYTALIIILFIPVYGSFKKAQNLSEKNVQATQMFHKELQVIINEVRFNQDIPIIFMSYEPFDFEALRSVVSYLRYFDINNEIMIKTQYESYYDNPLTQRVAQENINLEKKGNSSFKMFNENIENCFLVDFFGDTIDTKCKKIGRIWKLGSYPY